MSWRVCVSFVTTVISARGRPQVDIQFTDEAIREIAKVGAYVNKTVENIGARRLHTVLERIVEVGATALLPVQQWLPYRTAKERG